jgi:hypothetical protein
MNQSNQQANQNRGQIILSYRFDYWVLIQLLFEYISMLTFQRK